MPGFKYVHGTCMQSDGPVGKSNYKGYIFQVDSAYAPSRSFVSLTVEDMWRVCRRHVACLFDCRRHVACLLLSKTCGVSL